MSGSSKKARKSGFEDKFCLFHGLETENLIRSPSLPVFVIRELTSLGHFKDTSHAAYIAGLHKTKSDRLTSISMVYILPVGKEKADGKVNFWSEKTYLFFSNTGGSCQF